MTTATSLLSLRERAHPRERPYEWIVSFLLAAWSFEFLSADRVERVPAASRLIEVYSGERLIAGVIVLGLLLALQATIWTPLPRVAYRVIVALIGGFWASAGAAFWQTTSTVFVWSLCYAIAAWSFWRAARNGWSRFARG